MLQFAYEGQTYAIEFVRRQVDIKQEDVVVSAAPYTTATLKIVDPAVRREQWATYRTATVGKWRYDTDVKEAGRIHALRAMTKTIPQAMKPLMWQAYLKRTES